MLWLAVFSEVLLCLKQFSSSFSQLTSDTFCNCQGSHDLKERITASFWGCGSQACFSWGAEEPFCHSSGSYLASMSTVEVDYRLRCEFLPCQLPRHLLASIPLHRLTRSLDASNMAPPMGRPWGLCAVSSAIYCSSFLLGDCFLSKFICV